MMLTVDRYQHPLMRALRSGTYWWRLASLTYLCRSEGAVLCARRLVSILGHDTFLDQAEHDKLLTWREMVDWSRLEVSDAGWGVGVDRARPG